MRKGLRSMKQATLQLLEEFSPEDFDLSIEGFQQLLAAQDNGTVVSVDCLAVDNAPEGDGYWDITLPCGLEVFAIDGYHLIPEPVKKVVDSSP